MSISKNRKWELDQIDQEIFERGLRIIAVYFHKDLDTMLILLNNKRVLQRPIGVTERLSSATQKQLENYQLSRTGIHRPDLDEDLSLRGFLKEEMLNIFKPGVSQH